MQNIPIKIPKSFRNFPTEEINPEQNLIETGPIEDNLVKETLATDVPSKHLASFLSISKLLKYQLYFSTSLSMSITK